jgi:hypothetical protein
MARKDTARRRLLAAFKLLPRRSTEVTISFPSGEPAQTVDWKEAADDETIKAIAFTRLLTLPIDGPLAAGFKAAELDPTDPAHWFQLLTFFAWAHFGGPRRGAPTKRGALKYCKLITDFVEVKGRNPQKSNEALYTSLGERAEYRTKKGPLSSDRLRKLLKEALDPKRNELLHALELELGDALKTLQKNLGKQDGTYAFSLTPRRPLSCWSQSPADIIPQLSPN